MARDRDMESKAKNLMGSAKEKGIDMAKISQIMDSSEGKALLKQLSGSGGDALKHAAAQAADGDNGSIARLMGSLMSSKEGQALAKQVMELTKK